MISYRVLLCLAAHALRAASLGRDCPGFPRTRRALKGGVTRVPMDYRDFLNDPVADLDPCYALTEDERKARQEQLAEMAEAVALWR